MTERDNIDGNTLAEILVALLLFTAIAAATGQVIARSQRSRVSSGRWMEASELAGQLVEQLRAGERGPASQELGIYTRTWARQPFGDHDGLERFDVSVSWQDGEERSIRLSVLARRRPR